jgi:hypothetical protein
MGMVSFFFIDLCCCSLVGCLLHVATSFLNPTSLGGRGGATWGPLLGAMVMEQLANVFWIAGSDAPRAQIGWIFKLTQKFQIIDTF